MTTEEFLALPEDRIERELIRGHVKEYGEWLRGRRHSRTMTKVLTCLSSWQDQQRSPCGEILAAGAAFRLMTDPDTTVGVDVAYISQEIADRFDDRVSFIDAPPNLAVEILAPSDEHGNIVNKIKLFLESGVRIVWIVDPDLKTVTVYRPDAEPVLFTASQDLTAEPELPGFRVKVAELFG